jgi:hypothetical protein
VGLERRSFTNERAFRVKRLIEIKPQDARSYTEAKQPQTQTHQIGRRHHVSETDKDPKKLGKTALAGIAIGVLGLAGAGAFAFTQLKGEEKPNTPEEAVQSFLQSLETGDVIGLSKGLAPGERAVVVDSVLPMLSELSRLNILEKNFDASKVTGVTAKVVGLKSKSAMLRDDLARVEIVGGQINSRFDPTKLPLGDFVRKLAGKSLTEAKPTTDRASLAKDGNNEYFLQKVGKRWYVSLNYSAAEAQRAESGDPLPKKDAGAPAVGAATPEAAVSEMMQAVADLNGRRIIELLPPDELPALHDYSAEWLKDGEDAVKDFKKQYKLSVKPVMQTKRLSEDRTLVTISDLPFDLKVDTGEAKADARYGAKQFTASYADNSGNAGTMTWKNGTASGEFGTDQERFAFKYAKECLTLTFDGEDRNGCGQAGIAKMIGEITGQPISTTDLNTTGLGLSGTCKFSNAGKPAIGMVAVRREGKWFISPTRTMLDAMTAAMRKLEPADLDCYEKEIRKTFESFTSPGTSGSDPTFEQPLDGSDPFNTTSVDGTFDEIIDTLPGSDDTYADDNLPGPSDPTELGFDAPIKVDGS